MGHLAPGGMGGRGECEAVWGGKRGPESRWLDLIKPSGFYLLYCEDHDAFGPHWFSLRADRLCYF